MAAKIKAKKTPSIKKVLIVSFLVDLSDLFLNVAVAVLSGSVVMTSQALQGASDAFASGLMLVGFKRSQRPSDKNYPFGYGREMYFWTMMSTLVMLGVTATLSVVLGVRRFVNPQQIDNIYLAFTMLGLGLTSNSYAFSLSYKKLFGDKKLKDIIKTFLETPQIEVKTSLIQDLMGTLASLQGILALSIYSYTGDYRFDGVGAIVIGSTVGILSFILIDAVRHLIVGRKASDTIESKIKHAALVHPEVEEVLDLKTMYLGPQNILVNIEVHVVHKLKTREIEKLIDHIKISIKREVPSVHHVQVELETPNK